MFKTITQRGKAAMHNYQNLIPKHSDEDNLSIILFEELCVDFPDVGFYVFPMGTYYSDTYQTRNLNNYTIENVLTWGHSTTWGDHARRAIFLR